MASHTPGAPVFAPAAELPDWALRSVDLASPRLGAKALAASDDFFAEVGRMLNPEPAQFVPGKFDTNGKWMDGWESRRKRVAGQAFQGAHRAAIHAQAGDAAVRVDVHPQVRPGVAASAFEQVMAVGAEGGGGEDLGPFRGLQRRHVVAG